MSSTGRDSKVNMVVANVEVRDFTYHASQFLSLTCAPGTVINGRSTMFRPFICILLPDSNHQTPGLIGHGGSGLYSASCV